MLNAATGLSTQGRRALVPLLPAAMAAGTILYALLSVLASFIIDDLRISRAQLGWVVTVFALAGALLSPIAGHITDRIGARAAVLSVFAAAGAGFVLLAGAPGLILMMVAAVVVSVGQALANPSTNKMIAQEVRSGRRGLITGIKQSGVQVGTFIAGVSFPALAGRFGWRAVPLVVAGAIGVVLVAGWFTLPGRGHAGSAVTGGPAGEIPASTWWIAVYAFFMGSGGSPVFSFLPLYGTEAVGVSEAVAGMVVGVSALVGVAARILWSVAAERRGEHAWPLLIIALIAVSAGITTVLAEELGLVMLWISAILGFLSISAWNSVAMLTVIVEAGPRAAGRASGIVLLGFLGGLAFSPPLFGWSVDELGTYRPGFIGVTLLFAAASVTMAGWIRRRRRLATLAAEI